MPAMRYRALAAAIDWLCATFGFEKHRVVTADDGRVPSPRAVPKVWLRATISSGELPQGRIALPFST